jgi:hypothetical protein
MASIPSSREFTQFRAALFSSSIGSLFWSLLRVLVARDSNPQVGSRP